MKNLLLFLLIAFFSLTKANSKVINISEDQWEDISRDIRPIVIDVYASWCAPCKIYSPIFESLSKEFAGKVDFYRIDADRNKEFVDDYDIYAFPTTLFFFSEYSDGFWDEAGVIEYDELKELIERTLDLFEEERQMPIEFSFNTALDYMYGENGKPYSLNKAAEYFHRGAVKGDVESMKQLSLVLQKNGRLWQSFHWIKEAAETGDAEAQLITGNLLYNGYGCDQSASEAFKWWQKAAEQNDPDAEYNVAGSYYLGEKMGVHKDLKKAKYWYERAASHGKEEALEKIREFGL